MREKNNYLPDLSLKRQRQYLVDANALNSGCWLIKGELRSKL